MDINCCANIHESRDKYWIRGWSLDSTIGFSEFGKRQRDGLKASGRGLKEEEKCLLNLLSNFCESIRKCENCSDFERVDDLEVSVG